MYKKLDKSDITVRPFKAHKQWIIQNISSSLTDDFGESTYFTGKIVVNEGLSISGAFYTTESSFYNSIKEPINLSGEYKRITYSVTKSMFYETSDGLTERFGVEQFHTSPISQKEEIRDIKNRVVVGRINKDYWGEKISPGSVRITDYSDLHNVNKIIDDEFTNLVVDGYDFPYATVLLPSISNTNFTWNTSSSDFYFRGQQISYETAQQIKRAGGLIDYAHDEWIATTTSSGYQPQNEQFGNSVSAWNKYVIVGAPVSESAALELKRGSAFIYKFDEDERTHRLIKTVKSPFTASFLDEFGQSVSINYGFAAVGSPLEDIRNSSTGSGVVYVYDAQKGGQDHWGLINILEGAAIGDKFGWSVSNDSDVLAVGAPGANNNTGAVYIYRKKQYVSGSSSLCNTASMDEWQTVYSEGGNGAVGDGGAEEAAVQLGFAGDYTPANWTFDNNGGDGAVDLTGVSASVTVTGNNNGVSGIFTDFTTTATAAGQVSFDWEYFTDDSLIDSFGYLFNGVFNFLSDQHGEVGTASFTVALGDSFGFRIDGNDGTFGPGNATITNFSAPIVPESSPADSGSLLYSLSPAPYFISGNFTWQLETTISGSVVGDNFGYDVSISDDRLLVGTYVENGPGYAVLYTASYSNQTCPTASWVAHKTFSRTEEYDTFVEATTLGLIKQNHSIDYFGSDVSIDGDHFAICSSIDKKFILNTFSNETGSFGAVYFYSFDYDRKCKEFNVALRHKSFGDVSYKYNNNFAKSVSLRNGYAAVGISADQTNYSASMSGSALLLEKFIDSGVNAEDEEKALGRVAIYEYDSSNIKWNLLNTIKRTKESNQPHFNFGWSVALGDQFDENMYVVTGAPIFNDASAGAQSFITDSSSLVPPTLRGSAYVYDIGLLEKNRKIGNIFYKNGVIAITSDELHYSHSLLLSGSSGYEISYKGTQTIFENEYLIRISPGDFNYSTNPSAIFNYPLYFDINNSGFFDNQDVDLILKYLNRQKIYLINDGDNGIVFEQSTKKDESWWNHDVLQTESEDVLKLETVAGFVFLQQSIIDAIKRNLINTGILDIDGNGIIDMRDGALLLHYVQKTLTNDVVKKYIDNDSTRREFKDVKEYLDKYTGKRDFDVNSNFLSYIDDSAIDVTGSYLAPYITSIGLYNDENELVAVGKLGNPIKNLIDYPVNISVRFDT